MVQFKTIVYFDVGTTGVFSTKFHGSPGKLKKSTTPSDYSSFLGQFMGLRDVALDYPRITDIAMSAISFENNDRSAEEMFNVNASVSRPLATVDPIVQNLYFVAQLDIDPADVLQSNIINGDESPFSELEKSQGKFADSKFANFLKPLDQMMDTVHSFLTELPGPVCIVAHHGITLDFPVLLNEFKLQRLTLPSDVYFVDSYYGFNNVDNWVMDKVHRGVRSPWPWLCYTGKAPIAFLKKARKFSRGKGRKWYWANKRGEIFCVCTNLLAVYTLDYLYQALFGEDRGQHFSDIDVKDLMQVCFAYGNHFLYYIEKSAAPLISLNF